MQLNITVLTGAGQVQVPLQVLPFGACTVSGVCGFLLMYNIGSPQGTHAFSTTPQGACIILSAVGSAACIGMCLGVPHVSRRWRLREPAPVKRMSRLGLVSHGMHPKVFLLSFSSSLLLFFEQVVPRSAFCPLLCWVWSDISP